MEKDHSACYLACGARIQSQSSPSKLDEKDAERLSRFPVTKAYFFNSDGSPKTEGTLLKNPEYAQTLSAIAKQGAQAFYHGDIARDIIETVQNAPGNPGVLAQPDFDTYQIRQREPVCAAYQSYDICGMGPPSSGAHHWSDFGDH